MDYTQLRYYCIVIILLCTSSTSTVYDHTRMGHAAIATFLSVFNLFEVLLSANIKNEVALAVDLVTV